MYICLCSTGNPSLGTSIGQCKSNRHYLKLKFFCHSVKGGGFALYCPYYSIIETHESLKITILFGGGGSTKKQWQFEKK